MEKITKEQEAIIALAEFIEEIPSNEYAVVKNILDILGIEKVTPKEK